MTEQHFETFGVYQPLTEVSQGPVGRVAQLAAPAVERYLTSQGYPVAVEPMPRYGLTYISSYGMQYKAEALAAQGFEPEQFKAAVSGDSRFSSEVVVGIAGAFVPKNGDKMNAGLKLDAEHPGWQRLEDCAGYLRQIAQQHRGAGLRFSVPTFMPLVRWTDLSGSEDPRRARFTSEQTRAVRAIIEEQRAGVGLAAIALGSIKPGQQSEIFGGPDKR